MTGSPPPGGLCEPLGVTIISRHYGRNEVKMGWSEAEGTAESKGRKHHQVHGFRHQQTHRGPAPFPLLHLQGRATGGQHRGRCWDQSAPALASPWWPVRLRVRAGPQPRSQQPVACPRGDRDHPECQGSGRITRVHKEVSHSTDTGQKLPPGKQGESWELGALT